MNKKLHNITYILIVLIFIIILYINKNNLYNSIIDTSILFIKNVLPFLLPVTICINILHKLNINHYISKLFKNDLLYIVILSFFGGSPINAIILNNKLNSKEISSESASKILAFTTFNNPLFLINYFHILRFTNKQVFTIFFIYILLNIMAYIILKPKISKQNNYQKCSLSEAVSTSIKQSSETVLTVYTTIVFFKLITDIIVPQMTPIACLTKGIIETTQGFNCITYLTHKKTKEYLTLLFMIFSSFSIHIQMATILNKHNINYKYFYLTKIISSIILTIIGLAFYSKYKII